MADPKPTRRGRRLRKLLAALAVGLVALVAAVPWALSTGPARRWLLARANRALAPGGVRCESLRLSWFGPTRLANAALIDPEGKRVIAAPRGTWDRGLFGVLTNGDHLGTLTLDDAALDIERRADGSLDLVEALRPILKPNPRRDFHLRIVNASLRFRGPGLDGPLTAARADLDLVLPKALAPLDWSLSLANGTALATESLEVTGRAGRVRTNPDVPPDLTVNVSGRRWPVAALVGDVAIRGRYDGKTTAARSAGRWSLSGDAHVLDLDASGPVLAGDHVRLDRVGGTWAAAESAEGWAVDRLDLKSPVGALRASGRVPAREGSPSRIEGEIDLAAVARQVPHAIPLREGLSLDRGSAALRIDAKADAGRTTWDASARITDLVAKNRDRTVTIDAPATVAAVFVQQGGRTDLDRLALKTAFLDVSGRGDVDRGIVVTGTVDLSGLRDQARDLIDLGDFALAGRGELKADYRRSGPGFAGSLGMDLREVGLGELIRSEVLHLDGAVSGPASPSGLPRGWDEARLGASLGDLALSLKAIDRGEAIGLSANALAPFRLADRDGRADGAVSATWRDEALDVEDFRLALRPEGEGKAEPILLSALGRYDLGSGELTLRPRPGAIGAIALAPEGVRVSGLGRPAGGLRGEAALVGDLAALGRALKSWTDALPDDLAGAVSMHATARSGEDGLRLGGQVEANEIAATVGGARRVAPPLSLTWQAVKPGGADRLVVSEVVLNGGYATLEMAGSVEDPGGKRVADLRGTLTPDWARINAVLAERVEPRAVARGGAREVHLRGPLSGGSTDDLLRTLDAEFGVDLAGAEFFGMKVGPASLVARTGEKGIAIGSIATTINDGRLRLEPELGRDGSGGRVLSLKPGSAIEGAQINDEVSRRVLAFVAPVMDAATRAHGTVSVDVTRAEFPIGGDVARKAVVEGHVVFRDAEFVPGPLVEDLLHLVGRDDAPPLKLDEPVVLSIADGRVHQRGMAVPVGKLTRIELDGSVGFDRTLDLRAALPITPKMVGNNPLLGEIAAGAKVVVPIGGTLSAPRVDRDAFNLALKDLGKDLLQRGVGAGAAELLMRLARPREADPNAPPRPSAEERRALRQQRKADRQERRAERRGVAP